MCRNGHRLDVLNMFNVLNMLDVLDVLCSRRVPWGPRPLCVGRPADHRCPYSGGLHFFMLNT
eukprot:3908235-Pyramimonas_sp.AAC.1